MNTFSFNMNSSPKISKSKRSLPSSPNSPIQTETKKTKSFVSPNKFAVLANNEDHDVQLDTSSDTTNITNESNLHHQQDNLRAPPIYVQNITNYSAFKNALIQITGLNGFSCKSTSSLLIIRPHGRIMFNLIVNHLMDTSASFHTFMPPPYRPYKVIIRNLHHTTLISDISDALSELGHSTRRVTNIIKNGHPCPLFLVELNPNTNNKDILNLSSILHTYVKVELPYRTKSGPPQCRNCQNYGHTANYCHHPPRCVKCGSDHLTEDCTKSKTSPAKCALCMGNHTSNYKGCQIFKALLKRRKITQSKPQNPIPVPTSLHLQNTPPPPKTSYASVTNSKNIPLLNIHAIDNPLTKFLSELSSLITPLITLLSAVLNKQIVP